MKITREFIEAHRTKRGGFTNLQSHALGAGTPPQRGWLERAIEIDHKPEAVAMFIEFSECAATKSARRKERKERRQRLACVNSKTQRLKARVAELEAKLANKNNWSSAPQYNGDAARNEFLESFAWRQLRMRAIQKYGARCMCCGASRDTGAVIHVDHIKPRRLFPQLALDIDNLQILCHECNHGKGNWDQTDWREHVDPEVSAMLRDIAKEEPR